MKKKKKKKKKSGIERISWGRHSWNIGKSNARLAYRTETLSTSPLIDSTSVMVRHKLIGILFQQDIAFSYDNPKETVKSIAKAQDARIPPVIVKFPIVWHDYR